MWVIVIILIAGIICWVCWLVYDNSSTAEVKKDNFENIKKTPDYNVIQNLYEIKPILLITFKNLLILLETKNIKDILVVQCKKIGLNISESEQESWKDYQSHIISLFKDANIHPDCLIGFEWIQKDFSRIDLVLFGMDKNNKKNIILIELKSWKNRDENIYELLKEKNNDHPINQSIKYFNKVKSLIKDNNKKINEINLESIVYMYQYYKNFSSYNNNDYLLLHDKNFSEEQKEKIDNLLFTCSEKEKLSLLLNNKLNNGNGQLVFNELKTLNFEIKNDYRIALISRINLKETTSNNIWEDKAYQTYSNDNDITQISTIKDNENFKKKKKVEEIKIQDFVSVTKIIDSYLNINYSSNSISTNKLTPFKISNKVIELYFKNIYKNIEIASFIKKMCR